MTPLALETALSRHFADEAQACERELELARYSVGALSPAEAQAFEQHLQGCAECRRSAAALPEAKAVWDAAPAHGGATVLPFPRRLRLFAAGAAALAAGLGLWLALSPARPSHDDGLKAMGTWSLEVAARRGGRQFLAPDGTQLREGDQLGLFYSSGRDGYLTVLYADGQGAPVRLFPADAKVSAFVRAGSRVGLRDGAVLSEGSGCEWVVGFFSPEPLTAARAEALARGMVAGRVGCKLAPSGAGVDARVVTVQR